MAQVSSDQFAKIDANPADVVDVNEWGGRVRVAYWSYTTPTAGLSVNDTIKLVRLPKGARVLHGRMSFGAMSSSTGTATVDIGYSGAATRYASGINVDSAGESDFANTAARNMGDELSAEQDIIATVKGENWAGSKAFNGYILYVLD